MLKASRRLFLLASVSWQWNPFKVLHVISLLICCYSWMFSLAPELFTYCTDVNTCIRANWYVSNVLCDIHQWFGCIYSPFLITYVKRSDGTFYQIPVPSQVCFYLWEMQNEAAVFHLLLRVCQPRPSPSLLSDIQVMWILIYCKSQVGYSKVIHQIRNKM